MLASWLVAIERGRVNCASSRSHIKCDERHIPLEKGRGLSGRGGGSNKGPIAVTMGVSGR